MFAGCAKTGARFAGEQLIVSDFESLSEPSLTRTVAPAVP
jgi:hypothetical protein